MTYSFDSGKLAELVRGYRDREGLSLRDLADRTQLSAATLSRIENKGAKSAPDTYVIVQLANICGFRLEDIFHSDDDAGNSQIQEISTQLRASKQVSLATMQAIEAIIRAVQLQSLPNKAN